LLEKRFDDVSPLFFGATNFFGFANTALPAFPYKQTRQGHYALGAFLLDEPKSTSRKSAKHEKP